MSASLRSVSLLGFLLACLAVIAPQAALAHTYLWPDQYSLCSEELQLQDCINLAHAGDTILIGSPDDYVAGYPGGTRLISQNLVISTAITIAPVNGWDAVLAPGYSITINSPTAATATPFAVTLDRLDLQGGHVTINHRDSASATYSLSGLRITDVDANASTLCAINFVDTGAGTATFDAGDSELDFSVARSSGAQPNGICASGAGGSWQVDFFRNHFVTTNAALTTAISVAGGNSGAVWLENNRVRGNFQSGLVVSQTGGGNQSLWIHDNVVAGSNLGAGIMANGSNTSMQIANNSVVGNFFGLYVSWGGSGSARIANNLVAFNGDGLLAYGGTSNSHNLVYGNSWNSYVAGVGDVVSNPLLKSNTDPHLLAGSPAHNAGNFADAASSVLFAPAEDADGELRELPGSPSSVDIGAYEYSGDYAGTSNATQITSGYITAINTLGTPSPTTPTAAENIVVTPVANSNTFGWEGNWGVYPNSASPSQWSLYKEDRGASLTYTTIAGDSFNILAPRDGRHHILWTTAATVPAGNTAIINDASLNGAPWAIAFITHNWNGAYDTAPVGLLYDGSNWRIRFEDGSPMPVGMNFNVVVEPLVVNAFTTRVGGNATPYVVLTHPKLDNNPCAAPIVTLTDTGTFYGNNVGTTNTHPYGVQYVPSVTTGVPGHWQIVAANLNAINPSINDFPPYAAFNVMVDGAQADTCGMGL